LNLGNLTKICASTPVEAAHTDAQGSCGVALDIADQVRKLESHLIFNFCDKTPKLREYLMEQLRLMSVVGHYEFALGFKAGARLMSELLKE